MKNLGINNAFTSHCNCYFSVIFELILPTVHMKGNKLSIYL